MKFNLYLPHQQVLDRWKMEADKEGRSISQFIRRAVDHYISIKSFKESKEK